MRSDEDDVEYEDVTCTRETSKAILVNGIPDHPGLWVPKSQISDDSEVYGAGHTGSLLVSMWWAEKAGLDP